MKKALLISCFDWYAARLKPIKELLEDKGYAVTVLTSDFDHLTKRRVAAPREGCVLVPVPSYRKNLSLRRIFSHLVFGWRVGRCVERLRPDLIYLLLPPNNTARHCLRYRRRHPETRYVVDVIDLWPESMPLGRLKDTFPARLWGRLRDESLAAADYVFTECALYQERLKGVLPAGRTSPLYLFREQGAEEKALVERALAERALAERALAEKICLGYLGSMNHIIDIEGIRALVGALIQAGASVEFRAVGDGENRDAFLAALERTGCSLRWEGAVFEPLRRAEILARCDFGLNMMKNSVSVGLSIKSVDYLSMGLPLINSLRGDTWDLVERRGIGINVGNTETAAREILRSDRANLSRNALRCYEELFTVTAFQSAAKRGLLPSDIK